MNNRLSQRARVVFEQVVEMEESRQMAFLQQVCGDDQPLLAEVMKMIAADRRNAPLLDQPMIHWGGAVQTTQEEQPDKLPFNYIGNYKLIDKLGEGGMGEVYLAIEETLDRKVAIKLMQAGLSAEYLRRFNDERKVLATLNQRNIVTLYTSGEAYGRPYFVMEYLEGESLRRRLQRGPLPQSEIVEITRQICAALGAAHGKGIVHRDIKPENIVLAHDEDGLLVKVLDFGIAILKESDTRTMTNALVGTAAYFSPEQAQCLDRKEIDGRADIYSLGAMVYEMLTGTRVFSAANADGYVHQHINAPPTPPSQRQPTLSISPELDRIVLRALEKKPEARFNSAREFAQSLKQAVEGPMNAAAAATILDGVSEAAVVDAVTSIKAAANVLDTQPMLREAAIKQYAVDDTFNLMKAAAAVPDTQPLSKKSAMAKYALPLAVVLLLGVVGWWVYSHFNPSPNTSIAGNRTTQGQNNTTSGNLNSDGAGKINSQPNDPGIVGTPTATAPTAPDPSAAPSPELKIEIEQKGVGPVEMSKVFRSGAWVRLVASPNQNGLIYVLMKGTEGPAQVLYPDAELKQSYEPAQAGQRIELPPSKPQRKGVPWFRFDDRPGVETLYVVFTTKPGDERLHALETAIQQIRNKRPNKQRSSQLDPAEEQQTLSALEVLVAGNSASPTVAAKKILLRHER